ncbi:hypothetical protein Bmyc01_52740 [Bacillus mycoides]|uniref:hypothetical protein n=1 Tax=Bacillus cereus group TaxID=86661 RepID=UPI0018CE53C9|nr:MULTISPECIES: hypothetical protein [Bacillus cereus group]MBG9597786.1 hypothetical protein [Bacillus mycoides]MBG9597821.1 hypothetical protein [Bacillus mycoides]GLV66605.1 hypothetical protein Bmyc01_52740 [Bacillus mycoides]
MLKNKKKVFIGVGTACLGLGIMLFTKAIEFTQNDTTLSYILIISGLIACLGSGFMANKQK